MSEGYSPIADKQLDALQAGNVELYNAVLDAIDLIFDRPAAAQALSTAVASIDGIVLRLPVAGFPPYKVFWTSSGPDIEAVFPHP